MSLSRLATARIVSLTDDSQTAKLCNLFYAQTRDEVLRAFEWNFAIRRGILAELSTPNLTPYDYIYQLPSDCLRAVTLIDAENETYADIDDEYRVEGKTILTGVSPVALKYIARITEVTEFDEKFTEALIFRIASKIAFDITGDKNVENDMYQKYLLEIPKAKDYSGKESGKKLPTVTKWSEAG
jgi:hypothetical protein